MRSGIPRDAVTLVQRVSDRSATAQAQRGHADGGGVSRRYAVSRPHKYGAKAVEINGYRFPSQREAQRYLELRLLERAGAIVGLELQPKFQIEILSPIGEVVNCGRYTADFRYLDKATGQHVIEDAKSPATRTTAYRLRKRIVEAQYGIAIREI